MFKYLHQIWQSKTLRKRILFTLFILLVFRVAAHISVPGVDRTVLTNIFDQNTLLGVFSALTGGSMESFSIVLMGLSPYINASIIMQLMTVVVPKLEELSKDGMDGQRVINKYTRWLTIPLAIMQSYGMIVLLNQSSGGALIPNASQWGVILPIMLIVVAGTVLLMWLGELITEKGIGNGISLIIFSGIISGIPTVLGQMFGTFQAGDSSRMTDFILFSLVTLGMLIAVVLISEGQRKIPITYASRATRGGDSSLPIRVNQAGMIPIIFAISMITFPSVVAQFFTLSSSQALRTIADFITKYLNANSPSYLYLAVYFLLIIAFSYFYVSVTFNPEQVAENIQKMVGVILELIRQIDAQLVMHDYDKLY
ncbi:preprotein translocase subunit SecY [Candidatus Peregrinibacteria bacterium]|nr:MAG: preprotein translocase subunit SecY [Candidatus Peregrinibacteria bacterium]